jgi:protein-S-isoprenylcysteine O-methyltransferase Ste14
VDSGNSLDRCEPEEGNALSFGLYVVGFLIVIGGLVYGAVILHVPQRWIVVGGVVLLGLAILTGVKATRQKDKAD